MNEKTRNKFQYISIGAIQAKPIEGNYETAVDKVIGILDEMEPRKLDAIRIFFF